MSATYQLFTRWKEAKKFDSVTAAAKALHLHQTAITHWKNGRNGSASVIERMAKDLGEDPVPVILQAFAEAARDAEDKRTLGRLAKRLGAACVALVALVPLLYPVPTLANEEGSRGIDPLYIMRTWRNRLMAVLARLGALATVPRHQPTRLEPMRWNRRASCPVCP